MGIQGHGMTFTIRDVGIGKTGLQGSDMICQVEVMSLGNLGACTRLVAVNNGVQPVLQLTSRHTGLVFERPTK